MRLLLIPFCWAIAYLMIYLLQTFFRWRKTICGSGLQICCLATAFFWVAMLLWGETEILIYLTRFDLDGNGFIENSERTESAINAEPSSNDTWRLGLVILAPLIYLFSWTILIVLRKFLHHPR